MTSMSGKVSFEDAYVEACKALGEHVVMVRLLQAEVARLDAEVARLDAEVAAPRQSAHVE